MSAQRTPGVVVRLADVFRSEIDAVKALGCQLDVKTDDAAPAPFDAGGTAYARITPVDPRAVEGLVKAAAEDGAPGRKAIEVRQPYASREDTMDALREAIRLALDVARTAL